MDNTAIQDSENVIAGSTINVSDNGEFHQGDKHYNTYHQKAAFSEINLDPHAVSDYPEPNFTEGLLDHFNNQKLLILGGNYEFDKSSFAHHLAWKLNQKHKDFKVVEWIDKAENSNVFTSIVEETESSILLFNQITPHDVNYDIRRLEQLCRTYNHYLIITTDLPSHSWKLPEDILSNFWFEIPTKGIFSNEVLVKFLLKEFRDNKRRYPFLLDQNSIEHNTKIAGKHNVFSVAFQLKTIEKIRVFCRYLQAETSEISERKVGQIIEKITSNKLDIISQWFQTLTNKEKEVALALSIFDGLYDDQFFGATERLVNQVWKIRDTKLLSLDYTDLDSLLGFFNIQGLNASTKIILSRFPNQRQEFLRTIWFSHRRQLLSALPILEQIIIESVDNKSRDWELYGTVRRKEKIQNVISETLSDIGIIHLPVVENTLLTLAANDNSKIQLVTAKALARWRAFDKEKQLFDTLGRWQRETAFRKFIKTIRSQLTGKNESETENTPLDYIKATMALTLAFAANYDPPNQLSDQFQKRFKELIYDDSTLVKQRMSDTTVPHLIQNHLEQLEPILFKMLRKKRYRRAVSAGMANAYQFNPEGVEKVVKKWLEYCEKNKNKISYEGYTSFRDKVLMTVILTLARIKYENENTLNAANAYQLISQLQEKDNHVPINGYYLYFIEQQLITHDSAINRDILKVISRLDYLVRDKLIGILVELYLNQRLAQEGSEKTFTFGKIDLPVWIKDKRPLTEIEKILVSWLKEDNPIGQEIAMDTLIEYAEKIDGPEKEEIELYVKEKAEDKKEVDTTKVQPVRINPIKQAPRNIWSRIMEILTLGKYEGNLKKYIKNLLPILVSQKQMKPAFLANVADKLDQEHSNDGVASALGDYLRRFPQLFINIKIISAVVGIVLLFILLQTC